MNTTVKSIFNTAVIKHKNRVYCIERNQYRRTIWTYQDIQIASDKIANLLSSLSVKKGDKVGLCAPNGPLWVATFFACARTGIILVPIDVNSSDEFVNKIVEKTKASVLIKTVYRPINVKCKTIEIEQMIDLATSVHPQDDYVNTISTQPEDVLEIVFTSGSTGDPKGVVLTNHNIASNLYSLQKAWAVSSSHTLLSMIPLSHMFEQSVGFLLPFSAGSKVVYVKSVRPYQIAQALVAENITTVVTVPAFLELLRTRIVEKFDKTHTTTYMNSAMKIADHLPYPMRRYMFQGIYTQLGGSLRLLAVGGSALQPKLEIFWEQLGVHILQGYGLTETSPIASYSSLKSKKRGSVGKSLPGQSIKISKNNEILLAGDNVFKEYYLNPEATNKSFAGKYFLTGDIGKIDKDGYLYITGRQKNMLLSDSGLNIYPEDIESLLYEHKEITDCVICMLNKNNTSVLTAVILTKKTNEVIDEIVNEVNTRLASHQLIQNTILWPHEDFPRTPTRKVKRNEVVDEVNEYYSKGIEDVSKIKKDISKTLSIVSIVSGIKPEDITNSSNLVTDLGLDSLKRLELVSRIEEELGANINEADINSRTTFKNLESLVKSARRNPKYTLFPFSIFESVWFSWVRVILQLPILWLSRSFQKVDFAGELPRANEPVIYIANHTSHLDSITMLKILNMSGRSKLLIAAAEDYFFKSKLKSVLIRMIMPIIPIDRKGNIQDTLQRLGQDLDSGYSILLFPEGTRGSDSAKPGRFLPGIGVIAQELDVPIIPLRFYGNEKILKKGKNFPKYGKTVVKSSEIYNAVKDRRYETTAQELEKIVNNL